MKQKKIFICQTVRHLFVTISMVFEFKSQFEVIIFLAKDHQNLDFHNFNLECLRDFNCSLIFIDESEVVGLFKCHNIFNFSSFISNNIYFGRKGFYLAESYLETYFKSIIDIRDSDEIYIFHDKTFFSKYFINLPNVTLIEDGLANYSKIPISPSILKRFFRFLSGLSNDFYILGESRKIKEIYLINPCLAPSEVIKKCKPLEPFLSDTSGSKTNLISTFFKIRSVETSGIIFLTQGLDIAGLCDKEAKIKIYSEVFDSLANVFNEKILIKPHPSESESDYIDFYIENKIEILPAKIPFEAIALCLNETTKCFSLYTSAFSLSSVKSITPINLVEIEDIWSGNTLFDSSFIINESKRVINDHLKKS